MTDAEVPSAKLAALAVDRLIASGLMRADKRNTLIDKIAAGTMSGGDWKVEIELASAKAAS
ncbi:hypothetical protein [Sphingomonas sp. LM7]|uniref:hypothetical protein n=1 Tax=Sphingomonas sp. LM7 TaxID=1938607 RepID=UPI0012379F95|nr:hypothetical protein [Sphingomonas sp. LM7]